MNPNWYPGYYLDPKNMWEWLPEVFPHWLPPSLVRTPPEIPPEQWPEPSASPKPGYSLLDGLVEKLRERSAPEPFASMVGRSLFPDPPGERSPSTREPSSFMQPATTTPQPVPPWLPGAQWSSAKETTRWPEPTPEMHRTWMDTYLRPYGAEPTAVLPNQTMPGEHASSPPAAPAPPEFLSYGGKLIPNVAPPISGMPDVDPRYQSQEEFDRAVAHGQQGRLSRLGESVAEAPKAALEHVLRRGIEAHRAGIELMKSGVSDLAANRLVPTVPLTDMRQSSGGGILKTLAGAAMYGFAPVLGAYKSGEDLLTYLTGNPEFAEKAATLAPGVGPLRMTPKTRGPGGAGPGQPVLPAAPVESGGPRSTTVFSPSEVVPGESWGKFPRLREQPDPALFPERVWSHQKLSQQMWDPPELRPRPFEADYPKGAPSDATGRLLVDMEGIRLTAPYVVGRKVVGGNDEALTPKQLTALAKTLTGKKHQFRSPSEMGNAAGRVRFVNGKPGPVELRNDLGRDDILRVIAHEVGHLIDRAVGTIPAKGLLEELRPLYNTLNNPKRSRGGHDAHPRSKPSTPQRDGYGGPNVYREYITEAIRAYLKNPNYMKTVAPETAAAIRRWANIVPRMGDILQFNTLAGLGVTPLFLAEDARAEDAPAPK